MCGKSCEDTADCTVDSRIGHCPVCYVDKCEVDACTFGQAALTAAQPVSLADTATHEHTLDGMMQTFFRNTDKERNRSIGATARVLTRHGTQRIAQAGEGCPAGAEQFVDSRRGTKFLFLI